jgi:hypothetical protein
MNDNPIYIKLGQFTREEFADWLWRGLQLFYSSPPSNKINAFDDVGYLILQQESVCEGLAYVYENYVPESKRLLFRQAIGDVLRERGSINSEPINAFLDLIYLTARINATESLSALLPIIGNGPMGKQNPDVFFDTFAVLRSLAPSIHAYEAAFDLINSANFDDGYIFEAIKVLVECEPSQTAKFILFLEPRLSQLRKETRELGGDEWLTFCEVAVDWVQHILKLAPISWLKELWEEASHDSDQLWLFSLIFASNHNFPRLFIKYGASDTYFIRSDSREVPLKVSDKDIWTRRALRRVLICCEFYEWSDSDSDLVNNIYLPHEKKPLGHVIRDKCESFCRQPYQLEESYV